MSQMIRASTGSKIPWEDLPGISDLVSWIPARIKNDSKMSQMIRASTGSKIPWEDLPGISDLVSWIPARIKCDSKMIRMMQGLTSKIQIHCYYCLNVVDPSGEWYNMFRIKFDFELFQDPSIENLENGRSLGGYHIYIYVYICMLPPPLLETYILYDFTTKNTVSCCFRSRCETSPHRPRFCMTPPAGKVLVQVLFLLVLLLSVLVSVFIIRIVISILISIITNRITITVAVLATISTSITILIAK